MARRRSTRRWRYGGGGRHACGQQHAILCRSLALPSCCPIHLWAWPLHPLCNLASAPLSSPPLPRPLSPTPAHAQDQAIGRSWRMGQTREVTVRRFYVQGSVEQAILGVVNTRQTGVGAGPRSHTQAQVGGWWGLGRATGWRPRQGACPASLCAPVAAMGASAKAGPREHALLASGTCLGQACPSAPAERRRRPAASRPISSSSVCRSWRPSSR